MPLDTAPEIPNVGNAQRCTIVEELLERARGEETEGANLADAGAGSAHCY